MKTPSPPPPPPPPTLSPQAAAILKGRRSHQAVQHLQTASPRLVERDFSRSWRSSASSTMEQAVAGSARRDRHVFGAAAPCMGSATKLYHASAHHPPATEGHFDVSWRGQHSLLQQSFHGNNNNLPLPLPLPLPLMRQAMHPLSHPSGHPSSSFQTLPGLEIRGGFEMTDYGGSASRGFAPGVGAYGCGVYNRMEQHDRLRASTKRSTSSQERSDVMQETTQKRSKKSKLSAAPCNGQFLPLGMMMHALEKGREFRSITSGRKQHK